MKDLRERQFVSKLDRYQLEDKYLRLLEEMGNLKKLSNSQEDKIKRLATKMMRVSANPSACINLHEICSEKEKISSLECENNKLKNKVDVLRNQLLSHVSQRRTSKIHQKAVQGSPSNESIYQNENIRSKSNSRQYLVQNDQEGCEIQKHLLKNQELEIQKKEMASRILFLENELENRNTGNRREKIAENIQHIRNLRYIKECTGKLTILENENKSLRTDMDHLKKLLTETRRLNKEVTSLLMSERKKTTEMDVEILKSKDSELSLREKDERIRDLTNEMKILQEHNNELIELSTKYSKIEVENVQLIKKISEQESDHQILKNSLNNEQTNTAALQTVNSQLLVKLNELQRNIDTLTIQLMAFQERPVDHDRTARKVLKEQKQKHFEKKVNSSPDSSPNSEKVCKPLTTTNEKKSKVLTEQPVKILGAEKESQTDNSYLQESIKLQRKKEIVIPSQVDSGKTEIPEKIKTQEINGHARTIQNGNTLSPEKMIKLLEQAQISTPFETQKTRLKHVDSISESLQKQRLEEETKVLQDLGSLENLNRQIDDYSNNFSFKDPNQILSLFFEILKNGLEIGDEDTSSILKTRQNRDRNNNETNVIEGHCLSLIEDNINNIFCTSNQLFKSNLKSLKSKDKEEKIIDEEKRTEESKNPCICDGKRPNCFYKQINGKNVCCCSKKFKNKATNVDNLNYEDIAKTKKGIHREKKRRCSEKCSYQKHTLNEDIDKYTKNHSSKEKSSNEDLTQKKHKTLDAEVTESKNRLDEKCSSKLYDNSLLITKDQMEVHIVNLQFSKTAVRLLFQDNTFWNAFFFVSWDIQGQKTSFTPLLKYPKLNFDSSSIFVVSELFKFFDYIFEEYITFQIHVFYPNEVTHTIAQTKLCIKEVLDYPHNKMQYISSITSIIPCSYGISFGHLSLWVRLSCNPNEIKTFKTQRGIVSEDIYLEPISTIEKREEEENKTIDSSRNYISKENQSKESNESLSSKSEKEMEQENQEKLKDITNKTVDRDYDANNEGNDNSKVQNPDYPEMIKNSFFEKPSKNPNKSTSTSNISKNEEIAGDGSDQIEMDDMVEFNKMLLNNQETQVDSDNTLHDINEVLTDDNWDKYKKKSPQSLNYRNTKEKSDDTELSDDSYSLDDKDKEQNYISIELKTIRLFEGSYLFEDPKIIQLYIEYSFLGYFGKDMETESIRVPEFPTLEMKYNFRKEFQIDEKNHPNQRKILQKMLRGELDPCVKFIIVSEPLPEEQYKDCEEVGFAELNLKDYVLGNYSRNMSLLIKNENQRSLGHLRVIKPLQDFSLWCLKHFNPKITVNGIETMKNCL